MPKYVSRLAIHSRCAGSRPRAMVDSWVPSQYTASQVARRSITWSKCTPIWSSLLVNLVGFSEKLPSNVKQIYTDSRLSVFARPPLAIEIGRLAGLLLWE